MFHNADHIPFLQKLRQGGRATALDSMPILDEVQSDAWRMYCFTSSDVLPNMDVYERRVGLPDEWEFEECIHIVSILLRKRLSLEKPKND